MSDEHATKAIAIRRAFVVAFVPMRELLFMFDLGKCICKVKRWTNKALQSATVGRFKMVT
jgi:hypothetical protein